MELRELLILVSGIVAGASGSVIKYLISRKQSDTRLYTTDLADRRELMAEMRIELREIRECNKELQHENLKLEREIYHLHEDKRQRD